LRKKGGQDTAGYSRNIATTHCIRVLGQSRGAEV
jgi:hypothetical protein